MEELRPDPAAASVPAAPVSPIAPTSAAVPTPAAAAASAASDEKSKRDHAERIKTGSEAATALFKATLFAMAIIFVSVVSCVVIWRHWHSRVLVVEVSAEVQKTLTALGADIDLRAALLDGLNERLAGVKQIIAVQGLPYSGDSDSVNAVSLAPFGLPLSTDTITQIVDHIFGTPPRPTVRLELRCTPRACDDLNVRNATLVMNFSAPSGSRTAFYPVALGNRGLTRSVHQS